MKNFENFENNKEQEISASCFEDFRGKDLLKEDFSNVDINILKTIDFDTETIWPEKESLPKDFDPEKLLEEGKNPGLGIEELHEQGITGKGVVVAIIDQKLDTSHQEYKDSIIDYIEYDGVEKQEISMHGPAVASLLVGKYCGVAPGAKLIYKAVPADRKNLLLEAQALNDIIEKNKTVLRNEKVKIVSCSFAYNLNNNEEYLDEWIKSLKKAKESGVFVIDVGHNEPGANPSGADISFIGTGTSENKNDFENYLPWLYKNKENEEIKKVFANENIEEILNKIRESRKDLANILDEELINIIKKQLDYKKNESNKNLKKISIPSDYRTMASSWNKEGQYMYNGRGGISWSVPYVAGLFALILQVDPNIKKEEIEEIINNSAIVNKKGLRIINPKGIINLVKERIKK